MIDLTAAQLDIVRRILAAHVPECEVWAFGSRVTGKARPYSDLDLAVKCAKPLSLQRLFRLQDAFEESTLPFRVDVADWQRLSDGFRERLASEGARLWPLNPPAACT
ncbi:nucleotidyltransferase family protein [Methylohalobius crimeensis]|uniref:nucleotidyltransferase family protein n=1 Tax=Methylohalobius crimeensis TaxID=244365 RepID=UPI0003B48483|nr:nucleotidyltransferase domain-containing protein [Methylohalobius crimeensis]